MNRRSFVKSAAGAAVLASAGPTPAPAQARKPNFLLILGDNMQARTIAGRSPCRTPNINRLASEGLLFQRAYTNAAVCSPARNALLSGAFNWKFGTYNHPDQASAVSRDPFPGLVTYPSILREGGYRLGYNGKWHTSVERIPTDFGFHEIGAPNRYRGQARKRLIEHGWQPLADNRRRRAAKTVQWPGTDPFGLWGLSLGEEEETGNYAVADSGIDMIRRFSRDDAPWHIEVHFPEAQRGWPIDNYLQRYDAGRIPVDANFHDTFENKPNMQRREAESYGPMSDSDFSDWRAHYYASFEQLDSQVGRILDALEESGQADDTVVVFAADHGAPWGAHRMWLPCFAPYEEIYRIPMVVRWPGVIEPGSESPRLAQLHDLGHTFLDIAGMRPLPHAHGASLQPLFREPERSDWRQALMCAWYGQDFLMSQRMAITERHKYVFNAFDFDECYDLLEDPGEMVNVVNSTRHVEVVDDMRARLYELMDKFEDPYGDRGTAVRFMAPRYLPRGKRLTR